MPHGDPERYGEQKPAKGASEHSRATLSSNETRAYATYMRIAQALGREPTLDEAFPALRQLQKYANKDRVAPRQGSTEPNEVPRIMAARRLKRLLKRAAAAIGPDSDQVQRLRAEIVDRAHRLALQCLDPHGPFRDDPRQLREARETAVALLRVCGVSEENKPAAAAATGGAFGVALPKEVEEEHERLRRENYELKRELQNRATNRIANLN